MSNRPALSNVTATSGGPLASRTNSIMRTFIRFLPPAFSLAAIASFSPTTQAGIAACGDIHVEAAAECVVKVEGGCVAECSPLSFKAACAAESFTRCEGSCSASAEAECTGTCSGTCVAECDADPGKFDCAGSCQLDCSGNCEASCSTAEDGAGCKASCEATCSAECDAECDVVPPSADCEAQCEGCCEGSCTAEANLDCQFSCQSEFSASCEAELEGGCKVACEDPDGALFCDGQYVDHGGKLAECVAALDAILNLEVDASASASCSNGSCSAEAEASISCFGTIHPERDSPAGLLGLVLGAGLLAGAGRYRRRTRR